MTTLSDIFDHALFLDMLNEGYVRLQTHPTEPLGILNYTERAQFDRVWNDVTLAARGLIYNMDTGEIVARGFPKFFNWDDAGQPYPPTGPMVLSTKFDGSLGILYTTDHDFAVATRGSFASDQALHATERLSELVYELESGIGPWITSQLWDLAKSDKTALFEIIYAGNRIVVDYKGADRLVLLDVVDNLTGLSDLTAFDDLDWPDKADKRLISGGFSDSLTHDIPQGEEGFVLYWPGSGFRCKMKSAEYVELHRLVTGLSKKSIWEMLGQGKTTDEIKESVPDELFGFVDDTAHELNDQCAMIIDQIYADEFIVMMRTLRDAPIPQDEDPSGYRKVYARHAANYPETRPFLFRLLDGAQPDDIWKAVWKTLKPAGDTRAFARSEDVE